MVDFNGNPLENRTIYKAQRSVQERGTNSLHVNITDIGSDVHDISKGDRVWVEVTEGCIKITPVEYDENGDPVEPDAPQANAFQELAEMMEEGMKGFGGV